MTLSPYTRKQFFFLLLACWMMPSQAEELCPASSQPDTVSRPDVAADDVRTHITADEARVDSENLTTFSGSVKASQGNKFLLSDKIKYDRKTSDFSATGNITFSSGDLVVTGDSAEINLDSNKGNIQNSKYYTGSVNGRGAAKQVIIESNEKLRLEEASYTTCPPEHEAWRFTAGEITLDKSIKQGSASNAVLEVADIPIMYFPYIRFPLGEERMSGLLYPAIGVSDKHGTEFSVPFYWNIAPNMDSTITAHNMTARGLMLETELRYLTKSTQGKFTLDYLPDDKKFNDDRQQFSWQHAGTPSAGWSTSADYNYVSDTQYIDDFSSSLTTSSITHLSRTAALTYNSEHYLFTTRIEDYQNLTGTEPYKRLPQLRFDTRLSNEEKTVNYDITSELVKFDHKDESKIIGKRIKLAPYITYSTKQDAGYFSPKLSLHHIQYDLDHISSPAQPDAPSVSVPVFSLDTGIFLERNTEIAGVPLLHTLEPRLFYLYAPYKDQSTLPVFDTGLTGFGETLFFAENRFSGHDRVGDADQLTASITTRFYRQQDGTELFSATLGQIIYFQDRRVTLPGAAIETADRSNYIGLINFNPHRNWRLNGDLQWNPESQHTETANSRIQYNPGNGRVVNLDYRVQRNVLRTRGLSTAWRINPRWQLLAGNLYDVQNEHSVEEFVGLRYDNCCWGLRILGRKQFDKLVVESGGYQYNRFENVIFLELELKGFSSLGSRKEIDTVLENGILGYTRQ